MRHFSTATLFACCALVASCGTTPSGAAGDSNSAVPAQSTAIVVSAFRFQPDVLEISRGTSVTWTNKDAILHTVTSGTSVKKDDFGNYDIKPDGRFDGSMPDQGKGFTFTFTTAGTYTYFCSRHNNMTASVVVR
ncbi:MAG TPA: plastocyanin/azurin family copper-binding protein [Candidatus Limnocylindria bacterium]|nr:plastocyanin/azurin family copper-binding protein [Candidatus Limnocylindria bacterium]